MPRCAMCHEDRELRESHIIPKFVIRWMKGTNGTGYLRHSSTPNVRRQDGIKSDLLCGDCEGRLSSVENWFKRNIFEPHLDEQRPVLAFDSTLFRFAVSLLWRVLHVNLPDQDPRLTAFRPALTEAEEEWRRVLLDGTPPAKFGRVHVAVLDESYLAVGPTRGLSTWLARSADGTIVLGRTTCFVYAKLPRFVFWGEVVGTDGDESPTLVKFGDGSIRVGAPQVDAYMDEFLVRRCRQTDKVANDISEVQAERLARLRADRAKELRESDLGKVMDADFMDEEDAALAVVLAGHLSGASEEDVRGWLGRVGGRVRPHEPCPCGRGMPFGMCHGR